MAMTKKKIQLFIEIHNTREFDNVLKNNYNNLICAEIYNSFVPICSALNHLFTNMKLNWSNGEIVLLKVLADEIEVLERFKGQSEPFFMFILHCKIIKTFRGVDSMRFTEVAKQEINYFKQLKAGLTFDRPTYELNEMTPEEKVTYTPLYNIIWYEACQKSKSLESEAKTKRLALWQAARKRHRAELMAPYLSQLNFVLYWPHAKHAHPELYERWDMNNIIMVGREEIQLDLKKAEDVLYAGDADINEASMNALLAAPALVICFKLLDDNMDFVSIVRYILYEYIPPLDETKPMSDQPPQQTAFDFYKSFSPSREQVWKQRKEDTQKKREEVMEKRTRRLSEMQRLARQAIEEAIEAKKFDLEQKKMELLKAGKIKELDKLSEESKDDDFGIEIPEELPEPMEEIVSEEEYEDEYFPPAGLLIPAFYSPPNDVAKANGLAILFPNLVNEKVTPQPEFLPPHVLVLLHISKRYKTIATMNKEKNAIIHMGIFKGNIPTNATHIAYSVKQFDRLNIEDDIESTFLALMLSTHTDLPLLAVMDLWPEHVSRDKEYGWEECSALFPVNYGDDYPEFEDFSRGFKT